MLCRSTKPDCPTALIFGMEFRFVVGSSVIGDESAFIRERDDVWSVVRRSLRKFYFLELVTEKESNRTFCSWFV